MKKEKLGLSYGPLADSPETQLKRQGYTLKGYAKRAERMLEALYTLRLGVLLPDGMYSNILNRIHKQILKNISEIKKRGK